MSKRNRLANCANPYQGKAKRVLCLCSAGLLRSPTIAWVLSNPPYNCNTRAAGVAEDFALIPVDDVLMEWADEIVCAEACHGRACAAILPDDKPVHILKVPDEFEYRDPKLVKAIEKELTRVGFKG